MPATMQKQDMHSAKKGHKDRIAQKGQTVSKSMAVIDPSTTRI
jgi:hypothetical protein